MAITTPEDLSRRLSRLHHLFRAHSSMLRDAARNGAFYDALREKVTPGCAVLDIGSGTGIWAIVAAKLGAARVLAVEREEFCVPLITKLARANGVADRVEVAQQNSTDLQLSEKFDIVVSETVGHQGFDERIMDVMLDAKKRFLKRNGTLIPRAVKLIAAPARIRLHAIPAGVRLDFRYFDALHMNIPRFLADRRRLTSLAEPKDLHEVDLAAMTDVPVLANLRASWSLRDATKVNGFAVWAEAALTENVRLSTMHSRSWGVVFYPVEPFSATKGRLEFALSLAENSHHWTAELSSGKNRESQSYSPMFAYASLGARMEAGDAFG